MKVFEQTHDLLTRNQIQTNYLQNAQCPKILNFLKEIMPDGADLKSLIELLSSVLLYKIKLEKAIIFVGDQANGKSTLIELIISILGEQNISNISLQRLASNRFATSSMIGKILNAYGDLDIDSIEQTGMIKQVISHEHITVEKKNKNSFSTKIPIRLLYSANRLPEFPNSDEAIFRRFWVIKFPVIIPPDKRDLELLEKLTTPEEKAGFLNILLKNAQQLIKNNFSFTHYQHLEQTKSIWLEKSDSVSAFVETEVVINPNSVIKTTEFYNLYKNWCLVNKEKIVSDRMFFAKLEGLGPYSKGYAKILGKSTRVIRGATTKELIKEENRQAGQKVL
jgi:putative DNA primase/helicase